MITERVIHSPVKWFRVASCTAAATIALATATVDAGASTATTVTGSAEQLSAVSVIPGTTGAWAVGETCAPLTSHCAGVGHSLILRRSGTAWSKVIAPDPDEDDTLVGVSASSAGNAWAVGSYDGTEDKNLLLHWSGETWKQVDAPNLNENTLTGVATTSSTNAWVVGTYQPVGSSSDLTLIEHWDGKTWTQQASPDPSSSDSQLLGVTALSPTNAWAVGFTLSSATNRESTLILHWNGKVWAKSTAPPQATFGTELTAVTATSADNAWAVGWETSASTDFIQTLTLHWNGSKWAPETTPTAKSSNEQLYAVAGDSPDNVWAVGLGPCVGRSEECPSQTLTLHWGGTKWTHVASPSYSDSTAQNTLTGVAVSGQTVIADGSYEQTDSKGPARAILLRWDQSAWVEQ